KEHPDQAEEQDAIRCADEDRLLTLAWLFLHEARQGGGNTPAKDGAAGISVAPVQPARQSSEEAAEQRKREGPGERPEQQREAVVHRPSTSKQKRGRCRTVRTAPSRSPSLTITDSPHPVKDDPLARFERDANLGEQILRRRVPQRVMVDLEGRFVARLTTAGGQPGAVKQAVALG